MKNTKNNLVSDISASIVVFLVAVPLCLGIALGSGADPIAGIIAGIVGGIVVGVISGSASSVSGPAAGLISTVVLILEKVPVFEALLLSICLAGAIQILLGLLKTGFFINFVPVSALNGMLVAIGLLLILKQFPHLVGYDADFEGDETFVQSDGKNTFSEIWTSLNYITPLAVVVGAIGLAIQWLWGWKNFPFQKLKLLIPAPLLVVLIGIAINEWAKYAFPSFAIMKTHLVALPEYTSTAEVIKGLRTPDFKYIGQSGIWIAAFEIAFIASIESLLSIEAADKLDSARKITNPNRELIAQGTGNVVSGLFGGLPITSVIVRTSVNINAGAKTKLSAILHGFLLLVSVLLFPNLLNYIPLSALASILIFTGYKLAKPSLFKQMFARGKGVFIPFLITVAAILATDLLIGIIVGVLVGVFYVLKSNFHESVKVVQTDNNYLITFGQQVTFMNKVLLKKKLELIPPNSKVFFDFSKCTFIDFDITDILRDYELHAKADDIFTDYKYSGEKQKAKLNLQLEPSN